MMMGFDDVHNDDDDDQDATVLRGGGEGEEGGAGGGGEALEALPRGDHHQPYHHHPHGHHGHHNPNQHQHQYHQQPYHHSWCSSTTLSPVEWKGFINQWLTLLASVDLFAYRLSNLE